jgi:hypothetical protein
MQSIRMPLLILCMTAYSLDAIPRDYFINDPDILLKTTNALIAIHPEKFPFDEDEQRVRQEKIEEWHNALAEAGPMYDKYKRVIEEFIEALPHQKKISRSYKRKIVLPAVNAIRATVAEVEQKAEQAQMQRLIGNTSHIDFEFLHKYVLPVAEAVIK